MAAVAKFRGQLLLPPFLFLFFLLLQSYKISSGDGGELVAASFGLGVAHPSGYPIYLILGKLLSFLPFGSIPFKITLVSSLASTVLLSLIYRFLIKLTNQTTALFVVLLLLSSYSFVSQSLIQKFYTLNTLLIFIIFYLGFKCLEECRVKYLLTIALLFGLALGLHHTTFAMAIPVLFVLVRNLKKLPKHIIPSIACFMLGALNTIYILIRSQKATLLNLAFSPNLELLLNTLARKAYGKSSSTDLAKSIFLFDWPRLCYSISNIAHITVKQFGYLPIFFFFLGLFAIYKQNRERFFYIFLAVIAYSIFLSYLTFSHSKLDLDAFYIVANQYFVPYLVFFSIVCGYGFWFVSQLMSKNLRIVPKLLLLFPLIYIPEHYFRNNYSTNQVPHYKTIDQLFIKPVKSIYITEGDNDVFQGWYFKNVERFRDDICFIAAPTVKDEFWSLENGCNKAIYKDSYPELMQESEPLNLAMLTPYMKRLRLYSSSPLELNPGLSPHLRSLYSILDFAVMPSDYIQDEVFNPKFKETRCRFEGYLHYNICLSHRTDDVFTRSLCSKYVTYLVFRAKDLSEYAPEGVVSKIKVFFGDKPYDLEIVTNEKNLLFLRYALDISEYNKIEEFFLYEKK